MELITLLISVGLFTTVVALAVGLVSMAYGGKYDELHSTQLMFARVGSQAVTLILLVVALFLINS